MLFDSIQLISCDTTALESIANEDRENRDGFQFKPQPNHLDSAHLALGGIIFLLVVFLANFTCHICKKDSSPVKKEHNQTDKRQMIEVSTILTHPNIPNQYFLSANDYYRGEDINSIGV